MEKWSLARNLAVSATLALLTTPMVIAGRTANKGASFGYEIARDSSGKVTLKTQTRVTAMGMWLGLTLHPSVSEASNRGVNPVHLKFPLKMGYGITTIEIQPEHLNGTFEAAIWKGMLSQSQCELDDVNCKKEGFRLYGMLAYGWGLLTEQ